MAVVLLIGNPKIDDHVHVACPAEYEYVALAPVFVTLTAVAEASHVLPGSEENPDMTNTDVQTPPPLLWS